MADLALNWIDGHGDIVIVDDNLMLDDSLTTSVIISLFTDLRVNGERGWWGDDFNSISNHRTGSKLWTLNREKQIQSVIDDAQIYAFQSLKWLLDDKIVKSYQVIASNPESSVLLLTITIVLLDGSKEQLTFSTHWSV